jgi:hypothetical protein
MQGTRRQARRGLLRPVLSGLCLCAIALLSAHLPAAHADIDIGSAGTGDGQYTDAVAVAVDKSNGTVYVADRGNRRIDVYDSGGSFLRTFGWGVTDGVSDALQTCTAGCFPGRPGTGSGALTKAQRIAVDNDPASPTLHDVYVFDGRDAANDTPNIRLQHFTPTGAFVAMIGAGVNKTTGGNLCTAASGNLCGAGAKGSGPSEFSQESSPIALGPGGVVYVTEAGRVQKFLPSGAFAGELPISTSLGTVTGIAVDASGNFYRTTSGSTGAVRKYDPSGTVISTFQSSFNLTAIAVEPSGNVLVSDNTNVSALYRYDSSGVLQAVVYGTLKGRLFGISPFHTEGGDVFAVEESRQGVSASGLVHVKYPPPGPLPIAEAAQGVGSTKATLTASINPEGKSSTFHFELVDQAHFDDGGFSNPATVSTPESAPVGADFSLHPAIAGVNNLTPSTTYHLRAVATNADGSSPGTGTTFTTLPPVLIDDTWATGVSTDTATLHAKANPLGVASTGYFQYVDDATYQETGFDEAVTTPDVAHGAAPVALGSGEADVTVSAQPFPLESATTYHYRFVGSNVFDDEVPGPERTFTTFRLPDIGGADACPNASFRTGASAALPDCRAYEMVSPLDKNNGDIISPLQVSGYAVPFYQASSSGDGLLYSSFRSFGDAQSAPYVSEYLARRNEGDAWSTTGVSPPMGVSETNSSEGSAVSLENQYLAATTDLTSGWFLYFTDPPLTSSAPEGLRNVYRRDNLDGGYEPLNTVTPPHPGRPNFEPELQGVSADGSHAVFAAVDNLTPDASEFNVAQLYEQTVGGGLRLVSVLPDGTASKLASAAGTSSGGGVAAIRNGNYTHALSEDGSRVYWSTADHIYLRENAGQAQSALVAGECTEAAKACTVSVTARTSVSDRFLTAAADGSRALFLKDNGLFEFSAADGQVTQIAPAVLGLLGASEDARRAFFVSTAALAPGATPGGGNLYLHEAGGATSFVTTIGAAFPDNANFRLEPFRRTSRVSPDGTHVAFLSDRSLTDYDNTEADSGQAAIELFIYEAGGSLRCVSCNPGGGRPSGRPASNPMIHRYGPFSASRPLAAFIPGWQSSLYAPRVLSADGSRLFFNSYDSLSPRDTNGRMDVYEWEKAGTGSCDESRPAFSAVNGGCVSLISSGESPGDSEFVDATPSGDDVFFTTESALVSQDSGLVDIYDARVGGGLPEPPPLPAACEGDACQGSPSPPDDPTPASSLFDGSGNLVETPPKGRCGKGRVRRKGSCVAKGHAKKKKTPRHRRRGKGGGRSQ